MRKIIILYAFLLTALFAVNAQERQVTMDNQGKVKSVDAEMERDLKIFSGYKNFKEARIFQTSDSTYTLEILCQQGDETVRDTKAFNNADLQAFRDTVSGRILRLAPQITLNQEGRPLFLLTNTIIGLGFYGPSLPAIIDFNDDKLSVTTYLLTAGASYYLPYLLTKNKEVTYGDAIMSYYGQTRGAINGICLPFLFDESPDYKTVLGMGLLGSIAEGITGFSLASRNKYSSGRATAIGTYDDFGMAIGLLSSGFLKLDNSSAVAGAVLLGSAAGLAAGFAITNKDYYTWGDALILNGSGALGMSMPLSLVMLFTNPDKDNSRLYTLTSAIGAIGGLYAGDKLAGKFDFTTKEGIFTDLSELAGGLVGAGLGYLLSNNDDTAYKPVMIMGSLGALAGFALSAKAYSKNAGSESSKSKNVSFNFNVNPSGLFNLANRQSSGKTRMMDLPLLTCGIRF